MLVYAITGLFHRSCVEKTRGDLAISLIPPISWSEWVSYWTFRPESVGEFSSNEEDPQDAPDLANSSGQGESLEEASSEASLVELTSASGSASSGSSSDELTPPEKG